MQYLSEALANALLLVAPILVYIAWRLGVAAAEDVIQFIQRRKQNDYERTENCERV